MAAFMPIEEESAPTPTQEPVMRNDAPEQLPNGSGDFVSRIETELLQHRKVLMGVRRHGIEAWSATRIGTGGKEARRTSNSVTVRLTNAWQSRSGHSQKNSHISAAWSSVASLRMESLTCPKSPSESIDLSDSLRFVFPLTR